MRSMFSNASYGPPVQVLRDLSLTVPAGQYRRPGRRQRRRQDHADVQLAGLLTPHPGNVGLGGQSLPACRPTSASSRGLVLVPERRRLFPFMTVLENLEIGADGRGCGAWPFAQRRCEDVLTLSAGAGRAREQLAGSLSGGEQQYVARPSAVRSWPSRASPARRADRGARADLRQAAVRSDPSFAGHGLTVSHCRTECASCASGPSDYAYVLENGRLVIERPRRGPSERRASQGRLYGVVKIMITDMHCHFVPDEFLQFHARSGMSSR